MKKEIILKEGESRFIRNTGEDEIIVVFPKGATTTADIKYKKDSEGNLVKEHVRSSYEIHNNTIPTN